MPPVDDRSRLAAPEPASTDAETLPLLPGHREFVVVDVPGWGCSHASSIAVASDRLVATWFAGEREGSADCAIWVSRRSRSAEGSRTAPGSAPSWSAPSWSAPVRVSAAGQIAWNPVLWADPAGTLHLWYQVGDEITSWRTWITSSPDRGDSWSAPRPFPDTERQPHARGPVKSPPLLLEDRLLAPGSHETPLGWYPFVDVSTDDGLSWRTREIPLPPEETLDGPGLIQPALWRGSAVDAEPGAVSALLRGSEGNAFLSRSDDDGEHWSVPIRTDLPNNNSALSIVDLGARGVLCVHNPSSEPWGPRFPLVLSHSHDGAAWRPLGVIDPGDSSWDRAVPVSLPFQQDAVWETRAVGNRFVDNTSGNEVSYPFALLDGDRVVVSYTWQRRGIVVAEIPLSALPIPSAGPGAATALADPDDAAALADAAGAAR